MRRVGLVVAALTLMAAMIAYFTIDRWRPAPNSPAGTGQSSGVSSQVSTPRTSRVNTPANSRPAIKGDAGIMLLPDAGRLVGRLNAPDATAGDDIEVVQLVIESYRRANEGINPAGGLNEEIMDALRGKNPKHVAAFPPSHASVDAQGRLLDRWGSPYFFHPVSGKLIEIRSAGPDRKLWTDDDVHPDETGE
jgi:hypothetical protein